MIAAKHNSAVNDLVDHLFRHKAGQVVSTLTRIFGWEHLDLAEDVVQETLLKALQQWPFRGVPQNPGGWILQTAKNLAIDALRREASFRNKEEEIARRLEQDLNLSDEIAPAGFKSDQLAMMFACCHPILPREVQIALTLKILCGFSVTEIARAFLTAEATIAQRLVRAKRKLRAENISLRAPENGDLRRRLQAVLEVLYLLFNEGYNAHAGADLVRQDLCAEAIRLTALLAEHPAGNLPATHALLALMYLQAARLPSRVDDQGNLFLLAEQDRSRWDQKLIHAGLYHLAQAGQGEELTVYHLQAEIALHHTLAPSFAQTDWPRILALYDDLRRRDQSPVVALNRAVAVAMIAGPQAGIKELECISRLPAMQTYHLLPAAFGEFHMQLGDTQKAAACYEQALTLVGTEPERRFLLNKLKSCQAE